jgi:hypothetical protein
MTKAAKEPQQQFDASASISKESLYRTRWLMAHNHLHSIAHDTQLVKLEGVKKRWDDYLSELKTAEEVASHEA